MNGLTRQLEPYQYPAPIGTKFTLRQPDGDERIITGWTYVNNILHVLYSKPRTDNLGSIYNMKYFPSMCILL